jgi:hypothetical protein
MPTGTTRIRLRPANSSRVNFWGQLTIGTGWILYALFSMQRDTVGGPLQFTHWLVLLFGAIYLGYVLIHNAPVFGTQSYLEFTPGYLVHKAGLFRPKQVFATEQMTALELDNQLLRVRQKDGEIYSLSRRQVKGKRRKAQFREQLRQFAAKHGVELKEAGEIVN